MSFLEKIDYTNSPQSREQRSFLRATLFKILGLVFCFFFVFSFASLISYSKDDPSLRNATDRELENFFGIFGSYFADSLHIAIGLSMFLFPLFFLFWSVRLLFGSNSQIFVSRLVFVPFCLASTSIFFSTNKPIYNWPFEYGLGGIFGDTALKKILILQPIEINLWLQLISVFSLLTSIFLTILIFGFTFREILSLSKENILNAKRFLTVFVRMTKQSVKLIFLLGREKVDLESNTKSEKYQNNSFYNKDIEQKLSSFETNDERDSILKTDEKLGAEKPIIKRLNIFKNSRIKTRDVKIRKSSQAELEAQPKLDLDHQKELYTFPALSLLKNIKDVTFSALSSDALNENARMLEAVLEDYGVKGDIISVKPGPVVTLYELEPAAGLKASRVISLSDDIARSMSALSTRVSTIPGRSVIGIELPNSNREKVYLKELLSSKCYGDCKFQLPLALGKDIGGEPIVANLAKMPHLLIAGTTGSGKSVGINTMILSLLYRLDPEKCRLIMIDPKMLELSVYDGIPHLLSPVVTDPKKAVVALKWAVIEMEDRYKKMSKMGVRNIENFNLKVEEALKNGIKFSRTVQTGFDPNSGEPIYEEQTEEPEALPYIVIIVDEMADLMMVAGKEIEACIQRLAQMARAAGIHLIMATQRPSVDVITGTIKANFPTRISFQVTSKIDSRTILGEMGAEQLLGMGDMLYMANGGKVTRVHGPFVSDEEVEEVVSFLKSKGAPRYRNEILDPSNLPQDNHIIQGLSKFSADPEEDLLEDAIEIIRKDRKCSTSYIQRKLSIGYNRAAKIVETLEEKGFVSPANHVGKRDVLIPENDT